MKEIKINKVLVIMLAFATMIFVIGCITGGYQSTTLSTQTIETLSIKGTVQLKKITQYTQYTLFSTILVSNLKLITTILLGALSFGLISLVITFYNGYIIGQFFYNSHRHFTVNEILSHTLPHCGEIVAIIFSCAMSFYLARKLIILLKTNFISISPKDIYFILLIYLLTILSVASEAFISI